MTKIYTLIKRKLQPYVYGSVDFSPQQDDFCKFASEPQLVDKTRVRVALVSQVRSLKSDFFSTTQGFVASESFVGALTQSGSKGLRTFPAAVAYKSGKFEENKKYFFLEFSCRVDAFDFSKSEYEGKADYLADKVADNYIVKRCSSLVIRDEAVRDMPFFLLSRVAFFELFVSDQTRLHLSKVKLNGFEYVSSNEIAWDV